MIGLHIFAASLVVLKPPNFEIYTVAMLLMNAAVAFVDTLAEGLSAIITKMESRMTILKNFDKEEGVEDEEDNDMKAFGLYNSIRTFFRTIMGFVGGILSSRIPVRLSFAIIGAYPVALLFFTFIVFKEERVSQITPRLTLPRKKRFGPVLQSSERDSCFSSKP